MNVFVCIYIYYCRFQQSNIKNLYFFCFVLLFDQVEKICYLLTELTIIGKQQKEYLEEMDKSISMVASFEVIPFTSGR